MQPAWLELHRLAGRDDDAVRLLAHPHDAVGEAAFVDFDASRSVGRATDQTVGLRAGVLDGEIAAADFRRGRRRPGPGMADLERPDGIVVGADGGGGIGRQRQGDAGGADRETLHG